MSSNFLQRPARTLTTPPGVGLPSVFSQAAFLLTGAGPSAAAPGETLHLEVDGCRLVIKPVDGSVDCWRVSARLQWPHGIDAGLWSRALLDVNASLMRRASLAFALDELDFLVLMARVYGHDHVSVARQLRLVHEVWSNANTLVTHEASSPLAWSAVEHYLLPQTEALERPASRHATEHLVIDRLIEMGTDPMQACQMAATGKMPLEDADVQIEADAQARALLLSVRLGHAVLDGDGAAALRLGGELMDRHAIAMSHAADGHRLTSYWPCLGRPVAELQDCLMALGGLPGVLRSERTVCDPADTDFDALLPYI